MEFKCQILYCKKAALYAKCETNDPELCLEHTPNTYINIYEKSRLCTKPNCHRDAWYAVSILDNPSYCKKHAPQGYKYLRYKFCLEPKCVMHAHYGTIEDANPIWCYQHKKDNHIYYNNIICRGYGCKSELGAPSFQEATTQNNQSEGKFDLKICSVPNCMTLANYGKIGCSKEMCEIHKTSDMIYDPQNKHNTYPRNKNSAFKFKVDMISGSHNKLKTLAEKVKYKLFRQKVQKA